MLIKRIIIENFKGIKQRDVDLGSMLVNIYGGNAAGKTSLYDAFLWAWSGRDSSDNAKFVIKPQDADGNDIHNLTTSVTLYIEHNGEQIVLQRTYAEKYTKRRGTTTEELTSHTNGYFIDDIAKSQEEYQDFTNSLMPERLFRMLTKPHYFATGMKWTERRSVIMEMIGTDNDEKLLAAHPKLKDVIEYLGKKTPAEAIAQIEAKKKPINKELSGIPNRIDERSKMEKGRDIKSVEADIQVAEAAFKEAEEHFASIRDGGELVALRQELNKVKGELLAAIDAYQKDFDEVKSNHDASVKASKDALEAAKLQKDDMLETIYTCEKGIECLRKEFLEVRSKDIIVDTHCPTCSQSLPQEQIDSVFEKAQQEKADRLKRVKENALYNDGEIKKLQAELESLNIEALQAEYDKLVQIVPESEFGVFNDQEFNANIQKLENRIKELEESNESAIQAAQEAINEKKDALAALNKEKAVAESYEDSLKRIEELKEREKTLAKEYEQLESWKNKIEEYIRLSVSIIEGDANRLFAVAKFRMFDVQINGGIAECCDVLANGVPFDTGLSDAEKLNTGIDIIRTLSSHYGITAPLFIDRAGEYTNITETPEIQQIRLYVSKEHKELTVERS